MNTLISYVLRFTAVQKMWDTVNGYKTYISAVCIMLGGLGKAAVAASAIGGTFVACKDMACAVGVARGLGQSADAASFMAGCAAVAAGFGMLGLRHAVAKAADAAPSQAATPDTVSAAIGAADAHDEDAPGGAS